MSYAIYTSGTTATGGGGGGDASAANQAIEITALQSIDAGTPAGLGQTTMAASMPVVIASDQSAVPVSGTVAVTGVATKVNQDTMITFLTSIDAGTPAALGQAAMAASMPVVLASDQSSIPVTATFSPAAKVKIWDGTDDALVTAAGEQNVLESNSASIKTAVEVIDNFISGSRGLVTEDNSAAIKTAVETIDNFISGSRGLVTEDNSAAIKTAVEVIDNFISGSRGLVTEDNSASIKTAVEAISTVQGAIADAIVAAGATGSISAKLRRVTQGLEDLKTGIVLSAGTANIGDVDVLTLPADPLGANADAIVAAGAVGSLSAKLRRVTQGLEDLKTLIVLGAGTALIGKVGIDQVTANANEVVLKASSAAIGKLAANSGVDIGDVDVTSVTPLTGATNLGKAEDAPHTTGDVGVMALAVANEAGTALAADGDYIPIAADKMGQIFINPDSNRVLFRGSSATFRTLGRAGTAGQKILAIHNATGSSITVKVKKIKVEHWETVIKAVTVAPPIIRLWKFTAVPTNGNTITKNKIGGSTTSNASCTVWNDSSADGTGSGTTLTVTLPAGTILDQEVAIRLITAVGEANTRQHTFTYTDGIKLAALEGVCVFLDYTLATQNPTTDMWVASVEWEEQTT